MVVKSIKELNNKLEDVLDITLQKLYKSIVDSLPFTVLFKEVGETYYFSTEYGMDNVGSMEVFICRCQVPEQCIYIDDGTQVILQHPSFDFKLQLDSSGDGDFYSHKIETSKYEE